MMATKQPTMVTGYTRLSKVLPRPSVGGKPVASEGTKRISQMATHRANQKLSCAMPLPTKNVYAKAAVQMAAISSAWRFLKMRKLSQMAAPKNAVAITAKAGK
ncbi:hypothetical protein D3C72_2259190 [compost metagenome]